MLNYKYKFTNINRDEEVKINELFISSDLSFISGVTSSLNKISLDDKLLIETPYNPMRQVVTVSSLETVKRNGYIIKSTSVDVLVYRYKNQTIKYVTYKGVVYYAKSLVGDRYEFVIEGKKYIINNSDKTLSLKERVYIENDSLIIDNIRYNVIVGKDSSHLTVFDSVGIPFNADGWDATYVTSESEYVQKISIDNRKEELINIESITPFGYKRFVEIDGEEYQLGKHYIESEGFKYGLWYNGVFYEYQVNNNRYEDFGLFETMNNFMNINGFSYQVYSTASNTDDATEICIETQETFPSVIIGDRLLVKTSGENNVFEVFDDGNGNKFIIYQNKKYNIIKNLCDKVIIGSDNYNLTYVGDSERPYVGMLAYCQIDNKGRFYFKIEEIGSSGRVNKLKKVDNINGEWVDALTLSKIAGGGVAYNDSTTYIVNTNDGVTIDGINFPVVKEEYYNPISEVTLSRESIFINLPITYTLIVVDTLGSNKLICKFDIDEKSFDKEIYDFIVHENVIRLSYAQSYSLVKKPSTYGVYDLTVENWADKILKSEEGGNLVELSNLNKTLRLFKKKKYINVPITLSKSVNNDLSQSDLILNQYYDGVIEDSIDPIVDMDKDMYTPISFASNETPFPVNTITFNLHFRTRDLDTWKIYEDEGSYTDVSGNTYPLSLNYNYTNWFVTDYYPYNQAYNEKSVLVQGGNPTKYINKCIGMSDLLGLLYFTLDDVKKKRKKLTKSFLRLTYFDSTDPQKQNMLGTSTLFWDCNRHFDVLGGKTQGAAYFEVVKSRNATRTAGTIFDHIAPKSFVTPSVLDECLLANSNSAGFLQYNKTDTYYPRLDSQIKVSDRYNSKISSEGFYAYILKEFSNKKKKKRIYMKVEFFHAGIGVKIPMILPTYATDGKAISDWTLENLTEFKKGYSIKDIQEHLYIPIDIEYSKALKQFVYTIPKEKNFFDAVKQNDGKEWQFNLFELKIRPQ